MGTRGPGADSAWRRSARSPTADGRPQLQRDGSAVATPSRSPTSERRKDRHAVRLLSAYAHQRQQTALAHVRFKQRTVWSLQEAREQLQRLIGQAGDWSRLDHFLLSYLVEPSMRATAFASSLAATLELVREGVIEVHQQAAFAPIFLRKREVTGHVAAASTDSAPRSIE